MKSTQIVSTLSANDYQTVLSVKQAKRLDISMKIRIGYLLITSLMSISLSVLAEG